MRTLILALCLAGPACADPAVEAWVEACIADGARAFGGGRGALPPEEQRHWDPPWYCRTRALELCRFAADPAACTAGLIDGYAARVGLDPAAPGPSACDDPARVSAYDLLPPGLCRLDDLRARALAAREALDGGDGSGDGSGRED
ncbi:hypothetical protein [Wenxinia marina]|uniref:YARHG domain-containing protein n=1 Tax=Wenxinia marina DSM 24838 TaxID=1123501 RepID=A0A0D0QJR4_9RHOB|nr:hypothetical protein [Wenxinia marina]KIQ71243.1 hypothetical protein Wenmar_00009 [Wenxinia marina DSM 24838]GGL73099.1 hypothetical protein GCM10011392_29670 [Wenxinia marina]